MISKAIIALQKLAERIPYQDSLDTPVPCRCTEHNIDSLERLARWIEDLTASNAYQSRTPARYWGNLMLRTIIPLTYPIILFALDSKIRVTELLLWARIFICDGMIERYGIGEDQILREVLAFLRALYYF